MYMGIIHCRHNPLSFQTSHPDNPQTQEPRWCFRFLRLHSQNLDNLTAFVYKPSNFIHLLLSAMCYKHAKPHTTISVHRPDACKWWIWYTETERTQLCMHAFIYFYIYFCPSSIAWQSMLPFLPPVSSGSSKEGGWITSNFRNHKS